ncbi:uncharacterized protein [Euphorbia lathyris]|uniref:uncharacterized protein n=1 Tax=Euphorbia lathyris TaxID=212925 RepID=UPI0033134744
MQTKKRIGGRNASREVSSPRITRTQKKASDNVQAGQKKVTELITSSVRKQRCAAVPKQNREPVAAAKLINEISNAASFSKVGEHEVCNEEPCMFSPAFRINKIATEEIADEVNFVELFRTGDQDSRTFHSRVDNGHVAQEACESTSIEYKHETCHDDIGVETNTSSTFSANLSSTGDLKGTGLSSEVSAIYLAMKNSKLECVDEYDQDCMSTKEDDYEEFDDFDPFVFIKNLPELTTVVPTFRPMLLPKQTRSCPPTTLVLDLDETLVHSTLEPCDDADFTFPVNFNLQEHTVYVRCRPYLRDFMDRVANLFEIIIFTASQSIYAEQLLNVLDPKRKVFRHRVFRESCVFVEGNYLKDLSVLGRDLSRVIIIDNSPQAFGFQVDNGIPIESWFDDRNDQELLSLIPFLESLVGVEDVRPVIAKKFNLRGKIAAASYPLNGGDPLER